jgi:hypothetical protein
MLLRCSARIKAGTVGLSLSSLAQCIPDCLHDCIVRPDRRLEGSPDDPARSLRSPTKHPTERIVAETAGSPLRSPDGKTDEAAGSLRALPAQMFSIILVLSTIGTNWA